jgi:hypothetical protein
MDVLGSYVYTTRCVELMILLKVGNSSKLDAMMLDEHY